MDNRPEITKNMMHDIFIDELKKCDSFSITFDILLNQVRNNLISQGYSEKDGVSTRDHWPLTGKPELWFKESLWELVNIGILIPGKLRSGSTYYADDNFVPWFSITEFGKKALFEADFSPSDPSNFIDGFKNVYPILKPEIEMYVKEALNAFNHYLYFSSAVMLGVGSEGMLFDLAESIKNSHVSASDGEEWYLKKFEKQHAVNKYREIDKIIVRLKSLMDRNLIESVDLFWLGIGGLIKQHRNDAGHPTFIVKERYEIFNLFPLFISQAKLLFKLIEWFNLTKRL